MSSSETEAETAERAWRHVQAVLLEERDRIQGAIRGYPAPIPACDAQFNHLLEQRTLLSRELACAEAASLAQRSLAACRNFVGELAASPGLLSDETLDRLRSGVPE